MQQPAGIDQSENSAQPRGCMVQRVKWHRVRTIPVDRCRVLSRIAIHSEHGDLKRRLKSPFGVTSMSALVGIHMASGFAHLIRQ